MRPQLCDRRSSSPPPTSIARRYFSLASAPRLAAPAPRSRPPIALADYIFSAICSAKLLGQDHHRLTSSLPRSPGIITPPLPQPAYPPGPPSTSVIAPSPGPGRPTPATTPAPVPIPVRRPPSPHTAGGTYLPPPLSPRTPRTPAPLPQLSLNFRSSQAHHQVLLIRALPPSHRCHLPSPGSPPSPEPRTRLSRAAPQRRAPRPSDSARTHCRLSFRRHAQRRDATRRSSCSAPFGIDACSSADAHCPPCSGRSDSPRPARPGAPSSRPPAPPAPPAPRAFHRTRRNDHLPLPPAQETKCTDGRRTSGRPSGAGRCKD